MDKEKITELRTYRIIDNTLDELTKQNKNIESLTNRNTGMILKTTGTHPEVKPDYYIFIAWCSWFTNYNLTWLRYDIIWMQVFIYTLT